MTDTFVKDPDAVLDYTWDWSAWLASGETITSADVTVPTGIVKNSDSHTTTTVTAWLSGGTDGTGYRVTCRVTTSQGRTDDRSITISCHQR